MAHYSPSDPEKYIRECGQRLLTLFREEQATHRAVECTCNECQEDMAKAFKKLLEEGDIEVAVRAFADTLLA
ncbi:MAG: hypothetical protein AAB586_01200 [Patescibacteria group bacterium]